MHFIYNQNTKIIIQNLILFIQSLIILLLNNALNPYIIQFTTSILITYLITNTLYNIHKTLCLITSVIISIIYALQLSSIYNTGYYIHTLTLSNIQHYQDIGITTLITTAIITLLFIITNFIPQKNTTLSHGKLLYLPIIIISLIISYNHPLQPLQQFTTTFYQSIIKQNFTPNKTLAQKQAQLYYKDWIVKEPQTNITIPNLQNKNIIVFFIEGFSLNQIDLYNKYPNLTPNISNLIKKSTSFINYYNHTAATYRGLRGQLTSSFQYTGGVKTQLKSHQGLIKLPPQQIKTLYKNTLISLPDILKQHNYNTYFFTPHPKEDSTNLFLKLLNFDKIYNAQHFNKSTQNLKDNQLFTLIKTTFTQNKIKEPFFVGIYNIGTHAGQKTHGLTYPPKSTPLLNNTYNYDQLIGNLINFIQNNPKLTHDTAFIITSDHSAYKTQEYKSTYPHIIPYPFIDYIPFIIYYPNVPHQIIDAKGKTSLDFAPTILHMANITKGYNYFLGCSLFEQNCPYLFEYMYVEDNIYSLNPILQGKRLTYYTQKIKNFFHLSENISAINK